MKTMPNTEGSNALTSVGAGKPPATAASVFAGIGDVLIAFAAGPTRSDDDMDRLVQIYAELVAEFDPAVVTRTLKSLLRHNPRNPYRPSPQDVFEACKATVSVWQKATYATFFEGRFRIGEIPENLEINYLRAYVAAAVEELRDGRRSPSRLEHMTSELFDRIPVHAYPEGAYDDVVQRRRTFAKRLPR